MISTKPRGDVELERYAQHNLKRMWSFVTLRVRFRQLALWPVTMTVDSQLPPFLSHQFSPFISKFKYFYSPFSERQTNFPDRMSIICIFYTERIVSCGGEWVRRGYSVRDLIVIHMFKMVKYCCHIYLYFSIFTPLALVAKRRITWGRSYEYATNWAASRRFTVTRSTAVRRCLPSSPLDSCQLQKGTRALLKACRRLGCRPRFIFTSSIAALGPGVDLTDETKLLPEVKRTWLLVVHRYMRGWLLLPFPRCVESLSGWPRHLGFDCNACTIPQLSATTLIRKKPTYTYTMHMRELDMQLFRFILVEQSLSRSHVGRNRKGGNGYW